MHLTAVINLAQQGESQTVEFKKSTADVPRGHIENRGHGTNNIAELMRQANREPMTMTSDRYSVIVTFRLPSRDGGVNGGVNEGVKSLLARINQQPGLHAPVLAKLLNTSTISVERWTRELRNANQIEFIASPNTGGYFTKTQAPGTH